MFPTVSASSGEVYRLGMETDAHRAHTCFNSSNEAVIGGSGRQVNQPFNTEFRPNALPTKLYVILFFVLRW